MCPSAIEDLWRFSASMRSWEDAGRPCGAWLDTLNTLASGASAPSSPEPGQWWHDTGNNILKLRSLDNAACIAIGALDETNHLFSASSKSTPNFFGLTLGNDTSSPNTVLDIAAGGANDSTGSVYMRVSSATKKAVNSAWTAGTGNGSLDTGTWTASQFYHVHLIYNATGSSNYAGGTPSVIFQSPDEVLETVGPQNSSLFMPGPTTAGYYAAGDFNIRTNTSGQIRVVSSITTNQFFYNIATQFERHEHHVV